MNTLKSLGYSNRKVKSIIKKRKIITAKGANKIAQSIIWTHNWALWLTYNDHSHSEVPINLIDRFKIHLTIDYFKFFQANTMKKLLTRPN